MSQQQMTSDTGGIGSLLNRLRYFAVPRHQRDYSWPVGAVDQFLADVFQAIEDEEDYFLGMIVLVSPESDPAKRYQILDGQQRLATATMVYSAIRQWLIENSLSSEADKIQNELIGIAEIGDTQVEPRVVMNVNNQKIFQDTVVQPCKDADIQKRLAGAGRYSSDRRLLEAALRCREQITAYAGKHGPDPNLQAGALYELAKFLRDRVLVNCLIVAAPENAYTIFESLNDRGIDLSVLDLLKNHLLRQTKEVKQAGVEAQWTTMLARLGDRRADDFLKVYWTSRHGRIQRGRLFHELKRRYKTEAQVLSLASDLAREAERYASLEAADSDLWQQYSAATREAVRSLAVLGGKQTHPILLAAIAAWPPGEMERLIQRLVTVIVRYQVVGQGRTGLLEIAAARVAQAIFAKKHKNAKAAWQDLKTLLPKDADFVEDFRRYDEPKAVRARWLLRELEIQEWLIQNPGTPLQHEPVRDPEKVNLEHILPKNPGTNWKPVLTADPSIADECRDMLGNLCLLDKPTNKTQAAKGFKDKSAAYTKSAFLLTKEIAGVTGDWNRAAIEKRQSRLASLAKMRWAL